jgi:hypothetical protein
MSKYIYEFVCSKIVVPIDGIHWPIQIYTMIREFSGSAPLVRYAFFIINISTESGHYTYVVLWA